VVHNFPAGQVDEIYSVTRSTDSKGNVISGTPMRIKGWVPERYHHFKETYEEEAARLAADWINSDE